MDDLLLDFLTEASESLAVLDSELVKFEQDPNDTAILANIFRLMHTIKGTCGFLGLPRLESVAHAGEDVLGKFRDGELEVTPAAVTLILNAIDQIRALLEYLEQNEGHEPEGDDAELISNLRAIIEGGPTEAPPVAEAPAAAPATDNGPVLSDDGIPVAAELLAEVEAATAAGAHAASTDDISAEMAAERAAETQVDAPESGPVVDDNGIPVAAELLAEVEAAQSAGAEAASTAEIAAEMAAERDAESNDPASPPAPAPAPAPTPAPEAKKAAPAEEAKSEKEGQKSVTNQSIRVNVTVLEDLMTLVSELVLSRNNLLQMVRHEEDSEFTSPLQRLSLITSDLQESVMKTRMQPIGSAWAKLPRIVRDLAVETGKKIDLQMVGEETELDRQVLEMIRDPLTHMVRNSADHGLETPVDRTTVSKHETGVIKLQAYHEGGHIIIEIADDGRGLNMQRIRDKVIENGLATEAELDLMDETQIQQYIMNPGFSTAQQVTSVSGRGVGMDVVRSNIEQIGGTVQFKSIEGQGSTFTIKIPLTLAIVSALIVEGAGERFAIPQLSVRELVRASPDSEHTVETINNSPVLRLRNRLLPLIHLNELLGLGPDTKHNEAEYFVVVTQVGSKSFGIIVDQVFDTEEIVVKPVAKILKGLDYYSGNTILGDGTVIMILDPNGISGEVGQEAVTSDQLGEEESASGKETTSFLIFRAGGDELKAVQMALVARLEKIDVSEIEIVAGERVVQYRGRLMPLISFDPNHQWITEGRQHILVFTEGERSMGLAVDDIVDVVEDDMDIELESDEPGVMGSSIINGEATDIIDTSHYLTRAYPDWFDGTKSTAKSPATTLGTIGAKKSILLVDDSQFFRNLLTPFLTTSGFKVTTAETAVEALSMRDRGMTFDLIVSDIEMPEMNGYEFAEVVREDPLWKNTPLIALSSFATAEHIQRGKQVGFQAFVPKTKREDLLAKLSESLSQTEIAA